MSNYHKYPHELSQHFPEEVFIQPKKKKHFSPLFKGSFGSVIKLAGPIFLPIVLLTSIIGFIYSAYLSDDILILNYIPIMCAILWTGLNLFMGFLLGPILDNLSSAQRAEVFKRLIPKITVTFSLLAIVIITTGFEVINFTSYRLDNIWDYLWKSPWVMTGIIIFTIIGIQALLVCIPNEIRIFRQFVSHQPDTNKINRLGMMNTKFAAIQGILQLSIVLMIANIQIL